MTESVDGVRVGHWTDGSAHTGCTVILPPPGTVGSGFVAGGAPATRETDLLAPGMLVNEVHAIVLTGGSAFGLAAADGVVRYLEEQGVGFDALVARVPVVPAAALFDLWVGDASVRPGADAGYAACVAATDTVVEGNVGAGAGATVGKWAGPQYASKGGLGYASRREESLVVACVAAVNAFGDVLAEDGSVLAGARRPPGAGSSISLPAWPSTTLACVITNATLSKDAAYRVARMAAGGLARAIRPVYTMFDGDVVFTLATGEWEAGADRVGSLAATVTADAIRRGVLFATSIDGVPACADQRAG